MVTKHLQHLFALLRFPRSLITLCENVLSFINSYKFTYNEWFACIYVVVQFYPWFKFYFPLFLGMVMYDNEFKTKENKI